MKNYPSHKPIFRIIGLLLFLTTGVFVSAQDIDNEFEYRSELDFSYKLNKKIKISLIPEIRFNDDFTPDKYLFEGGLICKPVKFIALEGTWRYVINPRNKKETEYYNRYAFAVKTDKDFGRFNTGIRIRYTNDADDEISDEQFLRYKFSAEYNIPKCKFTPKLGVEAFHQLGADGGLYKIRYSTGVSYKLFKNNYLGLTYKFDYHCTEYLNKHIINLGYKLKF